ncbi:MAG: putative ABC transporter permease subunit [Limisphaerales bacterium]
MTSRADVPPLLILARTHFAQGWRRLRGAAGRSRLLTAVIAVFFAGYVAVSFFLFHRALVFVGQFPGLGPMLTERMLYLLFAFLLFLLLVSNLVITYSNLFKNRETQFLITLPLSAGTVFRWKFLESVALASWAFLLLVAPLLAAYGLTQGVAWHFYPLVLLALALFVVLPGVAGAWAAIHVARHLERRSFQAGLFALLALLLVGLKWYLQPQAMTDEELETRVITVLDALLARTRFAQFPWLPSYWLTAGVIHWGEGALRGAVFFLLVLASYVALFGLLGLTGLGRPFYEALSQAQGRGGSWRDWVAAWRRGGRPPAKERPVGAPGWLERSLARLPGLPGDARALVVKDARMFWRDTAQWGQSMMLFGLLAVYILNLRQFTAQLTSGFWLHIVACMNLGAGALNLATLTTRFVYPQFSLEGRRVWIVGLAPMGLRRVVLAKFWAGASSSLLITLGLMLLSCRMLQIEPAPTAMYCGVVVVMALTLNALAVALGVLYPNFAEENPSKIVSGFGGTFCLVLSFLYVLACVVLVWAGSPWARFQWRSPELMWACWAAFVALSFGLGWGPLRAGLRRLRTMEL